MKAREIGMPNEQTWDQFFDPNSILNGLGICNLTGTYNINLRHIAVSLMLNHGIPVLIVSKRFGHSKPSITIDVYGHQIPSRQEEAVPLMNNLMFER